MGGRVINKSATLAASVFGLVMLGFTECSFPIFGKISVLLLRSRSIFFGAFSFSGVRPFSFKSDSDFRNPFSALELHSFGLRDGSGKVGFQLLDLGCFSVLSQLSVFGLLRVVCYSFSAFSGRFSAVRSFGCSRLGSSSFSGLFRFIFLALKLLQYPCGMGV